MSDALAYCHDRSLEHHDVKPANVLVDRSGKIFLSDFGAAVGPGEESVQFTKDYASPELLQAHVRQEYENLPVQKIDAFGLGCVLFELACARNIGDVMEFTTMTLLEYIETNWGSSAFAGDATYSDSIRKVISSLLEVDPSKRVTPSLIAGPLRNSHLSPLLIPFTTAAEPAVPGSPLSMDNVQLGMFVQRGLHWKESDADGGSCNIGVVTNLDADAQYVQVSWASSQTGSDCYRIGAEGQYELKVGPTILLLNSNPDRRVSNGLVELLPNMSRLGQHFYDFGVIVGIRPEFNRAIVAPFF